MGGFHTTRLRGKKQEKNATTGSPVEKKEKDGINKKINVFSGEEALSDEEIKELLLESIDDEEVQKEISVVLSDPTNLKELRDLISVH